MNYNFTELTFASADGQSTVYAELYTPKSVTARGIVQLAHGMIDHPGRYKELADYLTSQGYIFAGHHHLGHGKTAKSPEELGFFAEKEGRELLVKDMHSFNRYLRDTFPTLPLAVLGHSMGSFITRKYIEAHPHSLRAAVILGTAGPNPLVGMGIGVAGLLQKLYGSHHRSELVRSLAFGSYNSRFPKEEGEWAWLTRDLPAVADRSTDPYTSFSFTVSAYIELFKMIGEVNSKAWFKDYPKELPTLIVSGDTDPVGDYGRGPRKVYSELMLAGCSRVSLKLYEGARHELFNELDREVFFSDLVGWLNGALK